MGNCVGIHLHSETVHSGATKCTPPRGTRPNSSLDFGGDTLLGLGVGHQLFHYPGMATLPT